VALDNLTREQLVSVQKGIEAMTGELKKLNRNTVRLADIQLRLSSRDMNRVGKADPG